MRRGERRSVKRQRLYAAIIAECSEREEFHDRRAAELEAMESTDRTDPRNPIDIAKAASAALRGAA